MKSSRFGFITLIFLIGIFFFFSLNIFFPKACAGGLVPCTNDCNLCYLFVGISNIVSWLMGSLLVVSFLTGMTIAGTAYLFSGAFPKTLGFAKNAFEMSLKGLVLALCAWLIVNSVMNILGYRHPTGGTWWQFECSTLNQNS